MLKVIDINKSLGVFNLNNVSLEVNRGEYFILLGPSGAGKSIVLEIIAGLIKPDSGDIVINNININKKRIQERKVGLVFQDLALFPHLSVRHNIAYPLLRKGFSRSEINRRVLEMAQSLSISHLLRRYPTTLSGGEQQRVALARTLALKPDILLLDEPLSSLDVELKAEIRKLLRDINRNGQTIIHVTHDYEEAIALGHKIAVMNSGKVEQTGTPQEVFSKPVSSFVAGFGGVRNFFEATLFPAKDRDLVDAKVNGSLSIYLLGEEQGSGYITFPENSVSLTLTPSETSSLNCFKGRVLDIYPQRFGIEVVIDIGIKVHSLVTQESIQKLEIIIGCSLWVTFKASSVRFIGKE
jgi:molybdopterin-binding protein